MAQDSSSVPIGYVSCCFPGFFSSYRLKIISFVFIFVVLSLQIIVSGSFRSMATRTFGASGHHSFLFQCCQEEYLDSWLLTRFASCLFDLYSYVFLMKFRISHILSAIFNSINQKVSLLGWMQDVFFSLLDKTVWRVCLPCLLMSRIHVHGKVFLMYQID
jgi:hypothetical protein